MTDLEHICTHEREFAILGEMQKSLARIESAVIGNGTPGLKTKVELNCEKIENLEEIVKEIKETVKAGGHNDIKTRVELNRAAVMRLWWAVGWIALSIGGSAFYIIRSGILK